VAISENAKDFIRLTLRTDPATRFNLKEMLAHQFIQSNKIPDLLPISTLVCPPSTTFSKQYLTEEIIPQQQQHQPTVFQYTLPLQQPPTHHHL
jgi:serine/threonine protein kinase